MVEDSFFSANPQGLKDKLKDKNIFIAGAGGLGSNVAMMLVRAGVCNITIVDFDIIEASNINRQFYFRDQIGTPKVDALKDNLLRINPNVNINAISTKITLENIDKIIPTNSDILLECFDSASSKAMFATFALQHYPQTPIITVSGLGGMHSLELIKQQHIGKLIVIGDRTNEASIENGTLSTRVMYVASMQAHETIMILKA